MKLVVAPSDVHMTLVYDSLVSHYSVIVNIIQKSVHSNASPSGTFYPGQISLGGEFVAWTT